MLIAYHGREADKAAILKQLAQHREADALIQGHGYWIDGKGCAVGCTVHSDDHMAYETQFGIPVAIAHLEDSIFEGLPVNLARQWPERLMAAIQPGSDLSRVHWYLLHWLLTTPDINPGIDHPLVRDVVHQCADLLADLAVGKTISAQSAAESAGSAARSAARSAAGSAAESAARSAAWSAQSAARSAARSAAGSAAESAARSAQSAAESAAESAASAAEIAASAAQIAASAAESAASAAESAASAAWVKISDRLIALIESAPIANQSVT